MSYPSPKGILPYETEEILNQYLLFHYGEKKDLLPYPFGPKKALNFPTKCITESLRFEALPLEINALDIGCAVGRSSFELSRFCHSVIGIDQSMTFIHAAKQLQKGFEIEYSIKCEGGQREFRLARAPKNAFPEKIDFSCIDVMDLADGQSRSFDIVLAANVLCRLPKPLEFLQLLSHLVALDGLLILTSPYSWLEEYTPQENWLGALDNSPLEALKKTLSPSFEFRRAFDLPLLIREHQRKYQWIITQVTIWKRKVI